MAGVYFGLKNYNEAKQTLEHVLKLIESRGEERAGEKNDFGDEIKDINLYQASIYFEMALIDKESGNFFEALENMNNTLKIEPNNPRYLDTKLELCIINEDKIAALEAFKQLKKADPGNKKAEELKKQIDEL